MKKSLLALVMASTLPFAASAAENLSYNYVEGDYIKTNSRAGDTDGWGGKVSYGVLPNLHVFGDYSKTDVAGSAQTIDQWQLGAGYNVEIAPTTDFVARAAYNRYDTGGFDFSGYSVEAGIRTAFGEHAEVYAMAGYRDYAKTRGFDPEGQWYGRLGAQVKLNQHWGINGDVRMNRYGAAEMTVGPRFSW